MRVRLIESRNEKKNANTVGQGTYRDSALHTAKGSENAGRPTTFRWCAGWY